MLKLKIFELFTTKIYIPICGFFGSLLQNGRWIAAIAIGIVAPLTIAGSIRAIISKIKSKR